MRHSARPHGTASKAQLHGALLLLARCRALTNLQLELSPGQRRRSWTTTTLLDNESQRPKKFRFLPRTSDHKTKKTEANTTTQNLPLVRPTGKNERTTHLLGLRFLLLGFPCDQFTNTEPPPQAAEDGRPLTARTGREKSTPEDTDEPEARRALTHGTNCDPFTKTPPGTESQK